MKQIQILGTGCPKCEKLAKNVQEAVEQSSIEAIVKKITNVVEISSFGVMMTPALVVDGEVKIVGKVPSVEEIKKLL